MNNNTEETLKNDSLTYSDLGYSDTFTMIMFSHRVEQFKLLKRKIHLSNHEFEDDAQHSFDLALTALYLINRHNLDLNLEKVLSFALVHDLVEVFSGDLDAITSSEEDKTLQKEREKEAINIWSVAFPYIADLITEYESLSTPEAKFVKILDKFVPFMVEFNTNYFTCKSKGVHIDDLTTRIESFKEVPILYEYVQSLLPTIRKFYE
jgi:putative hydrolase of HD superfamily